jgi:LAO/AO transport system kinase
MSDMAKTTGLSQISELVFHSGLSEQQIIAKSISCLELSDIPVEQFKLMLGSFNQATQIVGLTGPSGVGKSTLLCELLRHCCELKLKVAVMAIDPSSSEHGGAFLGDRIRLTPDIDLDRVYFRSMASGSGMTGLPNALLNSFELFSYFGFDLVFVETTGAGQLDTSIRSIVSTLVNVLSPFIGDEMQIIKSGLMDIGDVYFVNKSDLSDPGSVVSTLNFKFMVTRPKERESYPVVLFGSASSSSGIAELFFAIRSHGEFLPPKSSGRV